MALSAKWKHEDPGSCSALEAGCLRSPDVMLEACRVLQGSAGFCGVLRGSAGLPGLQVVLKG